mmetsp:Transcript_3410/g.10728  ORF Transcript_3410/g.10728 Transcript_3410/m.10728 type:complete len:216 (+) Transcript_3410:1560-2207(+)
MKTRTCTSVGRCISWWIVPAGRRWAASIQSPSETGRRALCGGQQRRQRSVRFSPARWKRLLLPWARLQRFRPPLVRRYPGGSLRWRAGSQGSPRGRWWLVAQLAQLRAALGRFQRQTAVQVVLLSPAAALDLCMGTCRRSTLWDGRSCMWPQRWVVRILWHGCWTMERILNRGRVMGSRRCIWPPGLGMLKWCASSAHVRPNGLQSTLLALHLGK